MVNITPNFDIMDTEKRNQNGYAIPGGQLGQNEFLHLLVKQLEYQDPLNPMENTEFIAQMAQFSALQEMQNVNSNLGVLQLYQASINNAQSINLIGHLVRAEGNEFTINDGSVNEFNYNLSRDAKDVSIYIYAEDGSLIRKIEIGEQLTGRNTFQWDMMDDDGNILEEGNFRYEVHAKCEQGRKVDAETFVITRIDGVVFRDGVVYLTSGEMEIPFSSVTEVYEDK